MPPSRSWRFRIRDILEAIEQIQRYTAGMDLATFAATRMVLDATLYRIAVIGEAANGIPAEVCSRHPAIPWRAIRGMRNRLVHEYFGVRVETVWETIQTDLPTLAAGLKTLLTEEPSE